MAQKCIIYFCQGRARISGYCSLHYDRHITPPNSLTKANVLNFMVSIQQILSAEWGMNLPRGLVPSSLTELSKDELVGRYKALWRILDTRIVPRLRAQARAEGFGPVVKADPWWTWDPPWETWEKLCLRVGRILYGEVLYHPMLPNGQIPDLVPILAGIQTERAPSGATHVIFAPLIVDAKFTISSASKELADYGQYCQRLEIWFFRWREHWLARRNAKVGYLSGHELATACHKRDQPELARLLRCLPLLWGEYKMAPLYGHGVEDF